MTISREESKRMKKMTLMLLLAGSILSYANTADSVVIDKQVTGINKESLESREITNGTQEIKGNVNIRSVNVSTEQVKNQKQKINLQDNKELEDELSQGMEKSNLWKWIMGALTVVGVAIIL